MSGMKKARRLYRCRHCEKRVYRVSDRQWIPSMCDTTGRMVRLMVVNKRAAG